MIPIFINVDYGLSIRCLKDKASENLEDTLIKKEVQIELMPSTPNKKDFSEIILPFKEIKIGDQIWADRNLDVTHFRNGDPIPEARTNEEWKAAGENEQPAWCYYDNDPENGKKYGKLYNWYAVNDPRDIAPKGWLIPSFVEWDDLLEYIEDNVLKLNKVWIGHYEHLLNNVDENFSEIESDKTPMHYLKSSEINFPGSDIFGFNAIPAGARLLSNSKDFSFNSRNELCLWDGAYIGSSQNTSEKCMAYDFRHNCWALGEFINKGSGLSVRCIKENTSPIEIITIGKQKWANRNLDITHFRNGDKIPEAKSSDDWISANTNKQPAWCFYNNNQGYRRKHGILYNWYAVNDYRGLAPYGWKVPSVKDWEILIKKIGGKDAGYKLKSKNGWDQLLNGKNELNFNAQPTGYRYGSQINKKQVFEYIGLGATSSFWSIDEESFDKAYIYGIWLNSSSFLHKDKIEKGNGIPVRCLKDSG